MRQAITVKFIGPSNRIGTRYKATAAAGSIYFSADNRLNPEMNARAAAHKLATKLGWRGRWHGGVIADGRYVFVLENETEVVVTDGNN